MNINKSTEVRITTCEHECEDAIYKFLRDSFFVDEPMNSVLKQIPKKEDVQSLAHLRNGYSLAAYVKNADGEERLAGVVLNSVKRRDKKEIARSRTSSDSIISYILGELDEKSDLWSKVTSDEVFETIILSVGNGFRGLKVGQKLIEESLKKAREAGLAHASVTCSSLFSSKIMEKLNYEKICEIRYENFRNENGEVLLKVENPHEAIIKYLKKL